MFEDNKKIEYLKSYLRYLSYDDVAVYELQLLWVAEILWRCKGNRTHAAQRLGISLTTLKGYVQFLEMNKIDVEPFDIASKTPRRKAYTIVYRNKKTDKK